MLKKIIFTALILVALIAGVSGYFYLKNLKKPKILATQAIPDNCAFVIESDDFLKLNKKLNETNLIWEELLQFDELKKLNVNADFIDSLIRSNEKLTTIFSNNKVYISAHQTLEKKVNFLFALNLPDINYGDDVIAYLKANTSTYEVEDVSNSSEKILHLTFKTSSVTFYCYVNSGLLVLSAHKELIEKSLTGLNKTALSVDDDFMKLEESAGKDNDFRIFINHRYANLFSDYTDANKINSHVFKPFAHKGWTELDVDLNPNEIILNGFTLADSSVFLSALKHQQAQSIEFTGIAPASTNAFMFIGVEDYAKIKNDLSLFANNSASLKKYSDKLDVDVYSAMQQLAGTEMITLRATYGDTSELYGLIKTTDREDVVKFLSTVADSVSSIGFPDSVYTFSTPDFYNSISLNFCNLNLTNCCMVNDYMLFAESKSSLKRYIDALLQNKTLKLNEKFIHFSESNLSSEANFYVYTSFAGAENFLIDATRGELKNTLTEHRGLFSKFNAAAYQLINYKGGLLNQAYVLYSPVSKQKNTSVWETQLDTVSRMMPKIVLNHKTGGKEVFIQDESNKIYLISNTGKIQWKKQLEGKIIGEIFQVDYLKNEKLQLLFNTSDKIHLIDRNGNYVQGYPIALPARATNGIAVFDYENNKDYRIVVACENKNVYNYTINGKLNEGFNFPQTESEINLQLKWLRINQKDYLLAADRSGNVYVTGRRGETRLSLKNKIVKDCKSWYIDMGKDISKSYIHFVDAENKDRCKLSLTDELIKHSFDSDLKIMFSDFAYVNDDKLVDCIIADESGFQILDDEGRVIVNYTGKENIDPHVSYQSLNDQFLFLVLESENGKCVPVNLNGKVENSYFPSSKTPPVITNFNGDGQKYILSNSGGILYCFSLNL